MDTAPTSGPTPENRRRALAELDAAIERTECTRTRCLVHVEEREELAEVALRQEDVIVERVPRGMPGLDRHNLETDKLLLKVVYQLEKGTLRNSVGRGPLGAYPGRRNRPARSR